MSSMTFDAAVRSLVRIHEEEINQLQQQLAHHGNITPTLLAEAAEDCSIEKPFHPYPEGLPTLGHMASPLRKTASAANGAPVTPKQTPRTPKQAPTLASQPRGAEHSSETVEPCVYDDQSEQGVDDCQGLKKSLKQWGMLVQGVLRGGDFAFVVREGWVRPPRQPKIQSTLDLVLAKVLAGPRDQKGGRHSIATLGQLSFQQGMVARPDSFCRRFWMCLSLLVIMYEAVALTMAPFDVIGNEETSVLETVSAIYWIADIIFNFLTGVYIHGKLEVRLRMIAKRYLCTWFGFDFTVAAMHVLAMFVNMSDASTSGTLLKLIRAVRALRLGRMLSWVQSAFSKVLSRRGSVFVLKIAQCLFALYLFVHINACLWYEIGKSSSGWVALYDDRFGDSAGAKYLVAMHWSLSQLQGNVDIYPGRSTKDRLFAVLSSFASIIFFALLVSTMTGILFTVRDETQSWFKQKRMVQSFFDRYRIKEALRKRAEYHLQLRKSAEHSIGYEDQDRQALDIFPAQLRWRLFAASRASVLEWHPVFLYLQDYHAPLFATVCNDAICWHPSEPEDDVFLSSTSSIGAYYIARGEFVFNPRFDLLGVLNPLLDDFMPTSGQSAGRGSQSHFSHSTVESDCDSRVSQTQSQSHSTESRERQTYDQIISQKNKTSVIRLYKGQLVTEISLWMPWVHAGDMSALSHGQCFSVRWAELVKILKEYAGPYEDFCFYATNFVNATKQFHRKGRSHHEIELMGFADVLDSSRHSTITAFRA